jgi:hypothetical protein
MLVSRFKLLNNRHTSELHNLLGMQNVPFKCQIAITLIHRKKRGESN